MVFGTSQDVMNKYAFWSHITPLLPIWEYKQNYSMHSLYYIFRFIDYLLFILLLYKRYSSNKLCLNSQWLQKVQERKKMAQRIRREYLMRLTRTMKVVHKLHNYENVSYEIISWDHPFTICSIYTCETHIYHERGFMRPSQKILFPYLFATLLWDFCWLSHRILDNELISYVVIYPWYQQQIYNKNYFPTNAN